MLGQHGLQTLKVSCDLETLVYFVVEIPWKYPAMIAEKDIKMREFDSLIFGDLNKSS